MVARWDWDKTFIIVLVIIVIIVFIINLDVLGRLKKDEEEGKCSCEDLVQGGINLAEASTIIGLILVVKLTLLWIYLSFLSNARACTDFIEVNTCPKQQKI